MTVYFEGKRSFFLGAQAIVLEQDRECASSWATQHVVHNPAHRYVLGRYVEADRANNNRQLFSLDGLKMGQPSLQYAPMNMNHQARRVVGAFVASELLYPTGPATTPDMITCDKCGEIYDPKIDEVCPHCHDTAAFATASDEKPYIEALGVFWRHYFRDEFDLVQRAHSEGRLFFSMETIPREIQCTGAGGCEGKFEYAGVTSTTYCSHLNERTSDKYLIEPHFTAGAILVPPVMPGWSNANIHSLVAKHAELAERIYDGVAAEMTHLEPREWELLMHDLLVLAAK